MQVRECEILLRNHEKHDFFEKIACFMMSKPCERVHNVHNLATDVVCSYYAAYDQNQALNPI